MPSEYSNYPIKLSACALKNCSKPALFPGSKECRLGTPRMMTRNWKCRRHSHIKPIYLGEQQKRTSTRQKPSQERMKSLSREPEKTAWAGPVMMTWPVDSCHSISSGPPGSSTTLFLPQRPSKCPATATAHAPAMPPKGKKGRQDHQTILTTKQRRGGGGGGVAPVPHASVCPEPRSHTRIRR